MKTSLPSILLLSIITFNLGAFASSDFDSCFRDLCEEENYDTLSEESVNQASEKLFPEIERVYGARLKDLVAQLQPPVHNGEIKDLQFYDINYQRCIRSIGTATYMLPTENDLAEFRKENPTKIYASHMTKWLGQESEKSIQSILFEKTKYALPPTIEVLHQVVDQRLNFMLSPAGREIIKNSSVSYVCAAGKNTLFGTTSLAGFANMDLAFSGTHIPTDQAETFQGKRFGMTVDMKAEMTVSPYTLKAKDHFIFFHELTHIVNSMERLGFLPKSSKEKLHNARACVFKVGRDSKKLAQLRPESQQLYDAVFENFPDALAGAIYKKTGKRGTPRILCEMLSANRRKNQSPAVYSGEGNRHHGNSLFRTLLVHSQINGDIPKSCHQYIKAHDPDGEYVFKDCFSDL